MSGFKYLHLTRPPVPPVLRGAESSKCGVGMVLTGSFSGKDVNKFVGGFQEEVWGEVEVVDSWLGLECDLTGPICTFGSVGEQGLSPHPDEGPAPGSVLPLDAY